MIFCRLGMQLVYIKTEKHERAVQFFKRRG